MYFVEVELHFGVFLDLNLKENSKCLVSQNISSQVQFEVLFWLKSFIFNRLLRIALSEVDRQNFVNSCRRLCTSPYTFPKTLLVKVRANWRCCHSRSTIASWTNVLAFEAIEQLRKWCSTRKKQKISNKPTNFHFFILWCENEIFK